MAITDESAKLATENPADRDRKVVPRDFAARMIHHRGTEDTEKKSSL